MFTANPINGMAPLTVLFTDTSSNSPTSWMWTDTYGDISTNENPTFTYANPGAYTVELIACNAGGCGTNVAVINVYSPFALWQLNYFGSTNDSFNTSPQGDYTGTGMSNSNKFMAGFNPLNSAAYLHIISVAASNNNVMVTYLGASGDINYVPGVQSRTNVLEFTAGMATGNYTNGSWTQVPGQTNILGVGLGANGGTGLGTVTNMTDSGGATNSPSRYYRVRVLLP
jgi:PKD repeat protein